MRSSVTQIDDLIARCGEPGRPLLMGIVNATPDSFSDAPGQKDVAGRLALATRLVGEGADLIDIGGESGVTNKPAVDEQTEIERVVPVIEAVANLGVPISIDTYKPAVAAAAIAAGACLINDVSGLLDPELADVAAGHGAGLVIMHTRAAPKQKLFPHYDDVVADVKNFLSQRIALATERGVALERIVIDPGPDFSKTPAESVTVLQQLDRLVDLNRPILLAASRKDFIGALTGREPRDRSAGTLAAVAVGVDAGAAILRVHDVAETRDFLIVRAALSGATAVADDLMLEEHLRRVEAKTTQ